MLCTPGDLTTLLGYTVDTSKATLLIECATAVVQATCGQRIVQVVNDTVVLDLDDHDGGLELVLPERPVTAVGAVLVGSTPVTDFTASLRRGSLWRSSGWRSSSTYGGPSTVTVTYTHGYPTGDQRLQLARAAVLGLLRGAYGNPTGATRLQIDDYAVQYEAVSAQMDPSGFLAAQLRRQYGRPSGSVVLVTG